MKSVIALVAVLALTGSVEAATKSSNGARSAKASKVKSARTAKLPKKKPSVSDVSAASSEVEMQSEARLADVKPIVQEKKWSVSAFNETYGAQLQSTHNGTVGKDGNGTLTSDNGVKVGYKVADTVTVSAAYEWSQDYGTRDAEAKYGMYDPSIRIAKSDLADLGNGVALSGQARYYAPLSPDSQDREQLGQIRLYGTATRAITKSLEASFTLNPRIFIQQNDTYINADGDPKNLDTFRLWSYAALKYSLNDMVAFEQTFGTYQKWKTNTDRADYLDASSSVYVTPVSWLELNLGIRQIDGSTDMRKTGLSNLYNDDQTEYFLITTLSI